MIWESLSSYLRSSIHNHKNTVEAQVTLIESLSNINLRLLFTESEILCFPFLPNSVIHITWMTLRAMVLNWKEVCPLGIFGNIWKYFCLSQELGDVISIWWGKVMEATKYSIMHRTRPPPRIFLPNVHWTPVEMSTNAKPHSQKWIYIIRMPCY